MVKRCIGKARSFVGDTSLECSDAFSFVERRMGFSTTWIFASWEPGLPRGVLTSDLWLPGDESTSVETEPPLERFFELIVVLLYFAVSWTRSNEWNLNLIEGMRIKFSIFWNFSGFYDPFLWILVFPFRYNIKICRLCAIYQNQKISSIFFEFFGVWTLNWLEANFYKHWTALIWSFSYVFMKKKRKKKKVLWSLWLRSSAYNGGQWLQVHIFWFDSILLLVGGRGLAQVQWGLVGASLRLLLGEEVVEDRDGLLIIDNIADFVATAHDVVGLHFIVC